ncbi:MAG: MCP four helix bundle domain-containing protein, partial [Chloroflexi bacterium]|nr:MCP four helix bundle domain-containing protein [Chloroflexota bacterium]
MKLNIRTKLIGSFLVVVALLLVVAAISWNGLNQLDAAVDHIVHEALPEDEEVRDLELEVALQTGLFFEYALTLDEEVLHEAQAQSDIIFEEMAQLEGQLAGEPELLQMLMKFEGEYDEFFVEAELFASLYGAGDTEAGLEALHVMVAQEAQMEEV